MFFPCQFHLLKSSHRTSLHRRLSPLRADIFFNLFKRIKIIFHIGIHIRRIQLEALVLILINFFNAKMILQFDRIFMNIERHFYVVEVFYRICETSVFKFIAKRIFCIVNGCSVHSHDSCWGVFCAFRL